MDKRVTIKDIAQIANVSHSSVSRSLNDQPGVSQKTKEKIIRIAKELNFEFNAGARSLSTRQTDTIGVVFAESAKYVGTLLYLNQLIKGIRETLEKDSIDCIIISPQNNHTLQSNIQRMIYMHKIDGLLIIHPEISSADWNVINHNIIPYVLLHFKPIQVSYRSMNYVFIDHKTGGYLITQLLIKNGRKKILSITEDSMNLQFIERTAGYKEAMRDYGLQVNPEMMIKGECSFDFGYQTIWDHQGILDEIDGVFAHADIVALGVISAIKDLGKRVPEDIAVVGYDDIKLSGHYRPSLTTVHQPREQMVKIGCEQLVKLIRSSKKKNGKEFIEPINEVLKPELVIRQSCPASENAESNIFIEDDSWQR